MVANPAPTLKPYHFRALGKAIAAADLDLAEGRPAAGWRTAPDVCGWKVADECVTLGFFERNIHGQSRRENLNAQRYRITAAGRAAYLPTAAEAVILTKLQTALDKQQFDGWLYWQELALDKAECEALVGKGWLTLRTTPGKQIGNRAYRIESEGSRVLQLFNQKEASMSTSIPLDDGRRVDPGTGEILDPPVTPAVDHYAEKLAILNDQPLAADEYIDPETGELLHVTDALTTDELATRAATATNPVFDADPYPARMAVVDPQKTIEDLQIALQNARRDQYEAERQRDEALKQLKTATALPNPGEYRQLQQTVNEQRQEINRLTVRVNEAESNGWKGQFQSLKKRYDALDEEVKTLRQPDLLTGAKITALTEANQQLQQQVDYLQSQLDERSVIDDAAEPGIQHDFIVGEISQPSTAALIAAKEKAGWITVYEVIHPDGRYHARIRRDTSAPNPIDAAIKAALDTPRPTDADHIADADDMVIIGLDDDAAPAGQTKTPAPTFAQITQALIDTDMTEDQFERVADAQALYEVMVKS